MDAELKERARVYFAWTLNSDASIDEQQERLVTLLADLRAETEARVVEAAAQEAERLARQRQGAWRVTEAIRALAPADYVAVRRDDLEWLLEEAETCEIRMPTSSPTLNAQYAERFQRIRAALAQKEIP